MAKGPDHRGLSDAEADLWRQVTADAKRLDRRDRAARKAPGPPPSQAAAADAGAVPSVPQGPVPARRIPAPAPAPVGGLPTLDHASAPGLDKRTFDRLRRGRVPIDSRLDLHGLTQDEAHRALHDFLAASQTAGRRCVLVITGKGSRGTGAAGVLRAAVPSWLNGPANRGRVLAFCHAIPSHGGEGALYVLLRRMR